MHLVLRSGGCHQLAGPFRCTSTVFNSGLIQLLGAAEHLERKVLLGSEQSLLRVN